MASRFWVLGTGTWDASDTTHWSATSGGAGGASVPGASDTVTFNASSGGGTCTVNTNPTIISLTTSAYTGTLDFSANDNNITLTVAGLAFDDSGSGTHTINMGDGTWTVSGLALNTTAWTAGNTNLTLNANGSTLVFSGSDTSDDRTITWGGKTYNNVTFSGAGFYTSSGNPTINGTLTLGPGAALSLATGTATIGNLATTSTLSQVSSIMGSAGSAATVNGNGTFAVSNIALRALNFSGGNTRTATDSINIGQVSGITVTAPSGGSGGGGGVIGS